MNTTGPLARARASLPWSILILALTPGAAAAHLDPGSGSFVFRRDGVLHRQVNKAGLADYAALVSSGLYDELVAGGLLVPHEEVDSGLSWNDQAARVLYLMRRRED
jgi:hypothetical protein